MHVAPQQVVYNVCRATLNQGVWTHYLEVFQEVVAEEQVLTFVHTSKNPGGMVNAGTVSLVKLDTPHYGPGPGLGRTKFADRYVLFFSVVPTCDCQEPHYHICHWRGVAKREWEEGYDPAQQVHPALLCAEAAEHVDADKYWSLLQRLDQGIHKGKKLTGHLQPARKKEYLAWQQGWAVRTKGGKAPISMPV